MLQKISSLLCKYFSTSGKKKGPHSSKFNNTHNKIHLNNYLHSKTSASVQFSGTILVCVVDPNSVLWGFSWVNIIRCFKENPVTLSAVKHFQKLLCCVFRKAHLLPPQELIQAKNTQTHKNIQHHPLN